MNRKTYHVLYASALLLLTACANDSDTAAITGGEQLRIAVSQTSPTAASLTRAENGLYTAATGFDGGETVRVFFNDNDSYSDYTAEAVDLQKRSALYGGTLVYPENNADVDEPLYAVYPSTSAASHTVADDQSGAAAYKQSDLMFATTTVNLSENRFTTVHELSFSHQLVKLNVVVTKSAAVTAVTKIRLLNVKRTVALTLSATELTQGDVSSVDDDAANDNIVVFSGSNESTDAQTYVALFPAQGWNKAEFLEVTADGFTTVYELTKSDWKNGHEYTINLSVDGSKLGAYLTITNWQDDGTITAYDRDLIVISPIADQTYAGSAVTPQPEVICNGQTLQLGTDYTLDYDNNEATGTATVYVIGKGDYVGRTVSATFNIVNS